MGSFNVACSISSISLRSGTKVAFIPLLPSEMNETIGRKYNKFNLAPGYIFLEPSCNWVSNEGPYQFYKPFSLPIVAEYNEYGGIEHVEENITSKIIKEYFGITVEQFVECIGPGRGEYDYYSPIFAAYFQADKKLLSDYDTKFNEDWLIKLGFEKSVLDIRTQFYKFKNHSYSIILFEIKENKEKHRQAGFGYEIVDDRTGKSIIKNEDTYQIREKFLQAYLDVSGYHIGYAEDVQDKLKLLRKMSGMFVHYDIYEMMTETGYGEFSSKTNEGSWINDAEVNEHTLKKLGFKFRCEDKSIDRYSKVYEYPGETNYVIHSDGTWSHICEVSGKYPNGNQKAQHDTYRPSQLINAWKKLTGIEIKVDEATANESKYGADFDEMREKYIEFLNEFENDEEKEKRKKREEKLVLLTSNPEALQKEIDEIKKDKFMYNLTKSLMKYDDDSDVDDRSEEEFEPTDEAIGKHIIKNLTKRKYYSLKNNPIDDKDHYHLPLKPRYDKYNMLTTLYEPNVKDGSIRQDIMNFCSFFCNCYAMNKVLMPTSNGYQFGSAAATYHLAKKTMELMGEILKEREEEELEYNEE